MRPRTSKPGFFRPGSIVLVTGSIDLVATTMTPWLMCPKNEPLKKFQTTCIFDVNDFFHCVDDPFSIFSSFSWVVFGLSGGEKTAKQSSDFFGGIDCLTNWHTAQHYPTNLMDQTSYGGFLQWWYPTTMGFHTKNDHFGVFWGYHHLRKHPYQLD